MTVAEAIRALEALEAQVGAAVKGIAALRESLQAAVAAAVPHPARDDAGNCLHPPSARVGAPVMGRPERTWCKACGGFLE